MSGTLDETLTNPKNQVQRVRLAGSSEGGWRAYHNIGEKGGIHMNLAQS